MSKIAYLHAGTFFDLANLHDPALRALGIADVYAPELTAGALDGFDAVYVAARLHPAVIAKVSPLLLDFLEKPGARMYVDGENSVGEWLPGTTQTLRGTNFWAWRVGEDVGRRSVNQDHQFWQYLAADAVHWHYHGVLTHPHSAVPLVRLESLAEHAGQPPVEDPWSNQYRAIADHPNTLLYFDDGSFAADIVVSTMDASYHHGSGFMPGASQLMYRMMRWLDGARLVSDPFTSNPGVEQNAALRPIGAGG